MEIAPYLGCEFVFVSVCARSGHVSFKKDREQRLALGKLLVDNFLLDPSNTHICSPHVHLRCACLQIFGQSLQSAAEAFGIFLAASTNYFLLNLSFKALCGPFLKLLIPNGNARFYLLRCVRGGGVAVVCLGVVHGV